MLTCQICGRSPAAQVKLRRHVGMLLMQRFVRARPTLCRCDVLYLARKDQLQQRRGSITPERQRVLGQKIIRLFGLFQP